MSYFNQSFIEFFKGLAANNHKEWFDENRKIYENEVKKPFYQLVGDVINEVAKIDTRVKIQVKDAVFRINRDTRFSNDKTPYKLHLGAVVSEGGRKDMQLPGLYFQLGIGETHIGGGAYMPDKNNLQLIREAILDNPQKVESLLNDINFKKHFGDILGEQNKRIPAEFKELESTLPIILNKQFYYMADFDNPEELLLSDSLLKVIMEHYEAGRPWNEFLRNAFIKG